MPKLREQFTILMRARLDKLGWEDRELAKKAKMAPSQLSKYLTGKTVPSLDIVERLAGALGLSPVELLGGAVERDHGIEECLDRINLRVRAFSILGSPEERADVLARIRRARHAPPDGENTQPDNPHPGNKTGKV